MHEETATRLMALNRQFYQTFALQFSATRQRVQPGVKKILDGLPSQSRLLDLGCGNGELVRLLDIRRHTGQYIGLDFSQALLDEAEKKSVNYFQAEFFQADISTIQWREPLAGFRPDWVLSFAVLHHLPGTKLRLQLLSQVYDLLQSNGRFVLSVWQFLNSPRLRRRIQPWSQVDIDEASVDPGDYLLDWRHGGQGLRYVHHYYTDELASLAEATGFSVIESFQSDGESGNLGLYQIWSRLP